MAVHEIQSAGDLIRAWAAAHGRSGLLHEAVDDRAVRSLDLRVLPGRMVERPQERTVADEREPAGVGDRLAAPLIRSYLRKQNGRALERLKEQLEPR